MPPPELMEELVEEALLRVPPDDPAHLVCAALACTRWCGLISSLRFRRRFREFHHMPPVLGVIHRHQSGTRFMPTSSFCPPYAADRPDCHAIDARHGRILFCDDDSDLVVMNPMTGEVQNVLKPQLPDMPVAWTSTLLCAAPGCDHLDCPSNSPFTVVALGTDMSMNLTSASVYASETDMWTVVASVEHPTSFVVLGQSILVGNALYFILATPGGCNSILEYDLGRQDLSVINIPYMGPKINLITAEDGGLGFFYMLDYKLYFWSRVVGLNMWAQHKVLDLTSLLPVCALSTSPNVIAVADHAGVIFMETTHDVGVFAVNLKLGQARKVGVIDTSLGIVPYESFYTPALKLKANSSG